MNNTPQQILNMQCLGLLAVPGYKHLLACCCKVRLSCHYAQHLEKLTACCRIHEHLSTPAKRNLVTTANATRLRLCHVM